MVEKKKIGLKTKLEFAFNIDDLEVPLLNFEIEESNEKPKEEIKIYKPIKKKKHGAKRESSTGLF